MLRRAAQLASGAPTSGLGKESLMGRRFRPGLGDAENKPRRPFLGRPLGFYKRQQPDSSRFPSSQGYLQILRLLFFLFAVCVTSLIVTFLTDPPIGASESVLYALTWAAWPVFLLVIYPVLLRRLTIRNSIEGEKDFTLMQKCLLEAKEGLLRDFVRLIQIASLERRGVLSNAGWTGGTATWTQSQAQEKLSKGSKYFSVLPKEEQWEIWQIFSACDADNSGKADLDELFTLFSHVFKQGLFGSASGDVAAKNISRLVDYDGNCKTGLSWIKFRAMVMLATKDRPSEELIEDLSRFFDVIDTNKDGKVTSFQLANVIQRMRIGLSGDDVSNFLYTRFNTAKPMIFKDEFIQWIRPYSGAIEA